MERKDKSSLENRRNICDVSVFCLGLYLVLVNCRFLPPTWNSHTRHFAPLLSFSTGTVFTVLNYLNAITDPEQRYRRLVELND
jgi:uncharacterized membrane protein YcfT